LGGNRGGVSRTYLNLMIVMGLGGLWHGAALSYLAWGLLHGTLLVVERPFLFVLDSLSRNGVFCGAVTALRILVVFTCVSIAWVFFKLPHFDHAVGFFTGMFADHTASEANILSRAIDNSLFQKFKNARRSDDGFRPLRTAAAYYQRALDDRLTLSDARKQSILNGPAITRNVERAVAATVVEWNKPYFDDAFLKKNTNALFSLVETLEAQGVRIFLYQLPYLAVVNETLYARMVRKTLAQVFGSDDNRWLNLEYNVEELRWDDGIHLDERSAIILASALSIAIKKKTVR